MIREITLLDAKKIADIYNYYIVNTIITFEMEPVSENDMQQRIKNITAKFPWIVYEENNEILGYAYAGNWHPRAAYKNTFETTIYLNNNNKGKGIGSLLYKEIIDRVKQMKAHVIIGGISLPNEASVAIHEKFRYTKVAHYKEVGYKFDKWIDVGYWQLTLK